MVKTFPVRQALLALAICALAVGMPAETTTERIDAILKLSKTDPETATRMLEELKSGKIPAAAPSPTVPPVPAGKAGASFGPGGQPTPTPTPAPKPSVLSVTLDPGKLRESWPEVPVGASLPLAGATISIWKSNQIGMRGPLLGTWPAGKSSTLGDPGPAGDTAALEILDQAKPDPTVQWYLLGLSATAAGQPVEWQRLVDRSSGVSAWFKALSFLSPGVVRREETWKEGRPEQVLDYDANGRVLSEFGYAAASAGSAAFSRRTDYRYRGVLLTGSILSDSGGAVLETIDYAHTLDGRIRQTEKRYASGDRERFVYRIGEEGLSGSWADDTSLGQSWLFDTAGRLVKQEDWKDGAVVRRVLVTWADAQGSRMASRETEEPASGRKTIEAFDEQGRVVQADEFLKDENIGRTSQEWDQDGHLILKSTVGPLGSESWTGEYQGGVLVTERYSKNGLPVKVQYHQETDLTEEVYLDGVLRLRAWYHGTDKYKEEDIRNGQVYRTRTYDKP